MFTTPAAHVCAAGDEVLAGLTLGIHVARVLRGEPMKAAIVRGIMVTRIRRHDKHVSLVQRADRRGVRRGPALVSQASYTALRAVFGVLCGSV